MPPDPETDTRETQAAGAPLADADRYRLLVDAITDYAIYMLDPDGRVSSWNPGAERFKGYEAHEIIGRHFSVFYTDEDRASGLPDHALRTAREQGRFEREGWRVRKDGARFWAHVIVDPIRSPAGELLGYAKVTRDLTERRAAEDALRASQEQFRLLVQGVTDYALYMLDADGVVTNWNVGAQRIKGYEAHEIVGRHFSHFYTKAERQAGAPAQALRIAAEEGRFEREALRVRKDGATFWAHVIIDPIRDERGQVIGYAKITRDITERVQRQRQLEEAREALVQSQKMDAIGQLTGGVAHDFNNLLMAVMGSLELLRKHLPPEPKAEALLENALRGAQRGASLTQRMLAFARKQELKPQSVDVAALARDLASLAERSVGPDIKVVLQTPPALPRVYADPSLLETSLLNLVLNARDAMSSGGRVTISADLETASERSVPGLPAGDYVRLAVADTGHGMDAETLARAAEPFFTTKGVGKGTGLGLSMVHGLAEQSGGKLRILSREGEGTRVEIWLPLAEADQGAEPVATATDATGERLSPLRVLAVDDDGLVLTNALALLEDLDMEAVGAASADEALAMLERQAFDVVITDFAMPQMNGVELAREIARRWPATPVILSSGYAEAPDSELPRLPKPYSRSDLRAALGAAAREAAAAAV